MNESPTEALFRYAEGAFARADDNGAALLVADSFLVDDGALLAAQLHRDRFARGCVEAGADGDEASAFWDAAARAIPPVERWFPRIEYTDGAEYRLRVRPAPPLGDVARVATHRGPDPRRVPGRKGPDIPALAALRGEAGTEEVALLSPDGYLIDGASSAFVWWRDDALHVVPAQRERVDSVTARSLGMIALSLGHEVEEEDVTPADLVGSEVWILNALHGIRPVVAWDAETRFTIDRRRLDAWRRRLRALTRRIDAD